MHELALICVYQVGILPRTGDGTPSVPQLEVSMEQLTSDRVLNNARVLERLSADVNADALMKTCLEDAALGRMAEPQVLVGSGMLADSMHVSPRFGVAQEKSDGSLKIRAVDDFTFSFLNAGTAASEKLKCDGLDTLYHVMQVSTVKYSKVRKQTHSNRHLLLFVRVGRNCRC